MDWEKSKDKWGDYLPGKIIDLTRSDAQSWRGLLDFLSYLDRPNLIKKNYMEGRAPPAIDELRMSGGLRPTDPDLMRKILTDKNEKYSSGRTSYPEAGSAYDTLISKKMLEDIRMNSAKRSLPPLGEYSNTKRKK